VIMNEKIDDMIHTVVNLCKNDWNLDLVDFEVAYHRSRSSLVTYSPVVLKDGYERSTVPDDRRRSTAKNVASVSELFQGFVKSSENAKKGIYEADEGLALCSKHHGRHWTIAFGERVLLSIKHLSPHAHQGARELVPKYSRPHRRTERINEPFMPRSPACRM